jgi:hypothetical protein
MLRTALLSGSPSTKEANGCKLRWHSRILHRLGYPAVLFIGVDDTGKIADEVDTERVLKSFSDVVESHVWPPIYTLCHSLTHNGRSCVVVIIPGSSERPHFAGKAYIRLGTQTKEASDQQFAELIAQRNSKARELLAWAGKQITPVHMRREPRGYTEQFPQESTSVKTCNAHFVTVSRSVSESANQLNSYPLHRIELGFDHARERLFVYIYFDR